MAPINNPAGAIFDINGAQTPTVSFSSSLSGSGGITLGLATGDTTGGTLILTASNSFTGQTNITAGTINVANTQALLNSTVNVTNNNSLTFASSVSTATVGASMGTGNIGLRNTYLTVGGNGASTTYSGR